MPALQPYIPPKDSDLANWSLNFYTLLVASPATYGLLASDATNVAAVQTPWAADYALAINPATRTPVTVAAKDTARTNLLAVVRPYAQAISLNAGVLTASKIAIGVNPRTSVPSPITAPTTNPVLTVASGAPLSHIIRFRDSASSPSVKAKPYGVVSCQIVGSTTGEPTLSGSSGPDAMPTIGLFAKNPAQFTWGSGDIGKTATYFARWVTRSGLVGPWGAIVTYTIAG